MTSGPNEVGKHHSLLANEHSPQHARYPSKRPVIGGKGLKIIFADFLPCVVTAFHGNVFL